MRHPSVAAEDFSPCQRKNSRHARRDEAPSPYVSAHSRGTVDAPFDGMTPVFRGRPMTGKFSLIPLILLAGVLSVSAQEALPPEPTHEKFTLFGEPHPVTTAVDFVGRYLGDGNGEQSTGCYPAVTIVSGAGWISIGPGYLGVP